MRAHGISGIPVVENGGTGGQKTGRLVGILTNRDVRFASDPAQKVYELMTRENLITVKENVDQNEAKRLLHHAPHRKAAGRRSGRQLRRADHRQGHREVAAQPERRQGRAGAAARRRGDQRRRRRLRARRAADRGRRRPARHRHRAWPFAARARRGDARQEALQLGAHHGRQCRDRGRHAGADRRRRRRREGRHRPGLDLHDPHRRRRRRAAALGDHVGGRGRRRSRA